MRYDISWITKQKFVIFCAGFWGAKLLETLEPYDSIFCFVDNSKEKQTEKYKNYDVISFEKYLNDYKSYKIILACAEDKRDMIEEQMKDANLKYSENFYYMTEFIKEILPYYRLKNFNELYMNVAQISVTERCTLKCKKCAHGCYNVPNNIEDLPLYEVKKGADAFFSLIDVIEYFHLIGGEPFLYKKLKEAIEYIGEKYRKQIINFCITTNGTILPKEEILKAIKKYNMKIMISDYSNTLPKLKSQYEKLTQILNDEDINYVLGNADNWWTDYGFDYVDRGFFKDNADENERSKVLNKVFIDCKTPCREIRGNKFYYCIQARTCADNLGFTIGKDDYLDLNQFENNYESKKILLDFEMGIIHKGYLDMCNFCNGNDRFKHRIPAAEQKE